MKVIEISKVFTMKKYPKKLTKDLEIDTFSDEYLIAYLLVEKFGGTMKVLKANQNTEGIKYADYLWNSKLWELKKASSLTAIDNRIRIGLKQIATNPGGIILILTEDINKIAALKRTRNRIRISEEMVFKVIIINKFGEMNVLLKK